MLESLVGIHWRRIRGYLHFEGLIRVVPNAYLRFEGDTQIQAYDHVVVFCLDTAMRKLEDYFN